MFSSNRLYNVFLKSCFGSRLPPLVVSVRANDDANRGGTAFARSFQQMKAGSIRQFNIAQQQIEILLLAKFFGVLDGMGHLHLMPVPSEYP